MSLVSSASAFVARNSRSGYTIDQSLRFNSADSTVLSLAASTSNTSTKFTFSFWMKPAKIGGATGDIGIWLVEGPNSSESAIQIGYNWNAIGDAKIGCYWHQTGTGNNYNGGATNAVYRDPSAWYHFVIAIDTTQASGSDRFKVYANGVLQDRTFDTSNYIPQNYAAQFNAYTQKIGKGANFYLSEFYLIRDQALTPSSFGETDTITGAWIPKKYAAAYGSKDIYFKFESSGVGTDSSGNGNNWTASGFSTSGTGTDVMSDTPTNNYPTFNPLKYRTGYTAATYSNGNLEVVQPSSQVSWATMAFPNTGKWYWEVTYLAAGTVDNNRARGLLYTDGADAGQQFFSVDWRNSQYRINNGAAVNLGLGADAVNDVLSFAWDADAGTITLGRNNTTSTVTGLPAPTGSVCYGSWCDYNVKDGVNFGQRAFAYTPPTGYKALSTGNLPEPTIKKGGDHFNTVLYTGTGSAQSISGVGFQPDLVWSKGRSIATNHHLFDVIRGVYKELNSNSSGVEGTDVQLLTAFNSDGFSLGTNGGVNNNGTTFVSWNWKANGAGSSNTAGTITSTVSANATAGFSIVTWTHGTGSQSIGHGLGVKPAMIIVKGRNTATEWWIWHQSLSNQQQSFIFLNQTTAAGANTNAWDNQAPTSTVFYQKEYILTSGQTGVAYCFSEVAGYSKFGSYTGNGSSDGPFVFCGFRPAWVMIKRSSAAESWNILDTTRREYNAMTNYLAADSSNAEASAVDFHDYLSNGFKVRNSGTFVNGSGDTYVYAAFAEHPFKYANAR